MNRGNTMAHIRRGAVVNLHQFLNAQSLYYRVTVKKFPLPNQKVSSLAPQPHPHPLPKFLVKLRICSFGNFFKIYFLRIYLNFIKSFLTKFLVLANLVLSTEVCTILFIDVCEKHHLFIVLYELLLNFRCSSGDW